MVKKISKNTVLQIGEDIVNYMGRNNNLPQKLTYNNTDLSQLDYVYLMSSLIMDYKNNQKLSDEYVCDNFNDKIPVKFSIISAIANNDNTIFKIKLLDSEDENKILSGRTINLILDGKNIAGKTNEKGVTEIKTKPLLKGTYDITLKFSGTVSRYAPTEVKQKVTVDGFVPVNMQVISAVSNKKNTVFNIKLTDSENGKVLSGRTLNLILDGKNIAGKTNNEGITEITTKALDSKTYEVTLKFSGTVSRYAPTEVKQKVNVTVKSQDNIIHYGYWVFGKDMLNVDLSTMKNNGVTDILLNYYAFTAHGESKVLNWIKEANNKGIGVHIWVQCFYDGEWHNPKTTDLSAKKNEIKKYANLNGVKGVHLDYLRYPGTAYKTDGGADAITKFVRDVRNENPNTFLSCAVMPENEDKYYYGQDIEALGKIVDAIIPMAYKGNYNKNSDWLKSITNTFGKNGTIWTGLQSYRSDNNTTKLTVNELKNDIKYCFDGGAKGVILFRYGLSENISFTNNSTSTINKTKFISNTNMFKMAQDVKNYIEANGKILYKSTYDGVEFTWNEMQDILTYCLLNLKSNCNAGSVRWCENATGDNISEDIYKEDYLDQAQRVHQFVLDKGQIPNYVTTTKSKKKVQIDHFTYCISKILVWYKNNGELPNYCTYNSDDMKGKSSSSSSSTGLKPYMESQGCDGMGQCTPYYCACNCLQQCLYRLTGIWVSEAKIAQWAGTTTSGTGHQGIESAVAQFNKVYDQNIGISWKSFSEVGWDGMQKAINNGAMLNHLLYRDEEGHYEVPKQITTDNVIVLNSLGSRCNYPAYCGYIETRSKDTHRRYMNGISQKSVAILSKR